tara:strand:+ start:283 stop:873 length:591 start_codon:yes stop_codon:yes gene_type:complete
MLKRIGILGDIGSGKSLIAKQFGYPVFNADSEVSRIYRNNISCYKILKNKLPKYIKSYPINKTELTKAILANRSNIGKIVKIVHPIVRKGLRSFLKKHRKKKIIVLDVPLLIENNLNEKKDILIFVDAKKAQINFNLKKRKNYNKKIIDNLRKLQKKLSYKKKLSKYIIKNDFKLLTIKKRIKFIKKIIENERNNT